MAGHDATRGGDDRDAHATEHAWNFLGADILAAARLADAGDLGDGAGLAAAAKLEAQFRFAGSGLVGDFFDFEHVALVFENMGDIAAHARPGNADLAFGRARRVADGGEEIGQGIGLHREKIGYQLALVTPGISPRKASSRKAIRLRPNLRM